jgi:hypothetical protein
MLSTFARVGAWFGVGPSEAVGDAALPVTSAPFEGVNDGGTPVDALGAARASVYQAQPFHFKAGGFEPSWRFKQPPGVGDAPQHVYATQTLAPVSIEGPGDNPASYFRWKVPPVIANFAMRQQGMAVDGGSFLLTGLYVPQPLEMMTGDVFAGSNNGE